MDLSEVGAELGSCEHRWEGKRTKAMQNRLEMQFSRKDQLAQGSYDGEVGRQGHPPNFVRPSIEGEHKFGGWICQRWVSRSAVAGIDGGANVLRKCKIGWNCSSLGRIDWRKAATVQKSGGMVIPKTLPNLL